MRSPNPEIPGVAQPAIDYAEGCGARLVMSTDPDADRLGVEVKTAQDEWRHLTGNQIAAIAAYYLVADPAGPRRAGELITTVATSQVVRAIGALSAGVRVKDDLLIGFKFIGQHLDEVRRSAGELAFAAEESHGYLTSDELRDKDAASAAPVIAHLHVVETSRGRDLWSYLMGIYDTVGVHVEFGRSLVFPGAEGAVTIDRMMESLRAAPPTHVGGEPVSAVRDRLSEDYGPIRSEGERSARNLLEVETGSYRVVVRPSGTEAKLKYYFNFRERDRGGGSALERYAVREGQVRAACDDLYRDLALRVGLDLPQEAIDLPDVLPVDEKMRRTAGV
jgi:phosphomannomutase